MTKIIVDMQELSKYQKELTENVESFDTITKKMTSIVEDLSQGWQGNDARVFIDNSTVFLNNLKKVRDTLSEESDLIARRSRAYNNRIEDFYNKIGGKEEDDEQHIS